VAASAGVAVMADQSFLRRLVTDLQIGFTFLTRLSLTHREPIATGELSAALWTAPLVGVVVGFVGAGIYWLANALHLPPLPAAVLAVAATALVTGALHEDGLADVADGFGGGATRERKLDIMRDSRIGTYGVCALIVSFMLRVAALTNLGDPALVAAALVTAHAAGRAPLPAFMRLVLPARADGLSADAGRPPVSSAVVALLLGLVALLMVFGFATCAVAIVLLAIGFGVLSWLSKRQIGGQTGDVLGALEQVSESVVLLVAVAAANTLR
jgi:adenosylcobinamide-GDP ribazoletransferase